ncbi:MAG: hypothetical protein HP046_15665 [Parabacteroides sp.]|jgi:hypothetical protein|nr:hypothetical protein [Parabacteroides sp.]
MKTLELKDICGYLPYGLKFLSDYFSTPHEIVSIDLTDNTADFSNNCGYTNKSLGEVKPILRPMSDLTKEITHRGEKFVPLGVLNNRGHFIEFDTAGLLYTVGGCMDSDWLMVFDKFHEWMFDYRGLISAGLAIDVNTLPENPYEL